MSLPFVCFLFNRCFSGAQEGVCQPFQTNGGGLCDAVLRTQTGDRFEALHYMLIVMFHGLGKT